MGQPKGDPSTVAGEFPGDFGGGGGGSGDGIDSETIYESGTGSVSSGTSGVLGYKDVPNGGIFEVTLASLSDVDGSPVPNGLNLVIFTADGSGGASLQATVLQGDGSTVLVDETGSPLDSYENTSGSQQTVGAAIDNGDFGSGASSGVSAYGKVQGRVKL